MVRPIIFGIHSLLEEYILTIQTLDLLFTNNFILVLKTKFVKFLHDDIYIFSFMLGPKYTSILHNTDKNDLGITNLVKHINELRPYLRENNTRKQRYETNK